METKTMMENTYDSGDVPLKQEGSTSNEDLRFDGLFVSPVNARVKYIYNDSDPRSDESNQNYREEEESVLGRLVQSSNDIQSGTVAASAQAENMSREGPEATDIVAAVTELTVDQQIDSPLVHYKNAPTHAHQQKTTSVSKHLRNWYSSITKKRNQIVEQFPSVEGYTDLPQRTVHLLKKAMSGNVAAAFTVGFEFDTGTDELSVNSAEAIYWYSIAAQGGNDIAANNLGVMYATGHNDRIPKDYPEALHWFHRASSLKNNANAQFHIGLACLNGEGQPVDDRSAFIWFKKAAKQGHALAQSNVGSMYMAGRGVSINYKKARKWLLKAAKKRDVVAAHNLAVCYAAGYGGSVNVSKSRHWLLFSKKTSAIDDHLSAQILETNGTLFNC